MSCSEGKMRKISFYQQTQAHARLHEEEKKEGKTTAEKTFELYTNSSQKKRNDVSKDKS